MDGAVKWLREKGIAFGFQEGRRARQPRAGGLEVEGGTGVIVEFQLRDRFCGADDKFKAAVAEFAEQAFKDSVAGEPKAAAAAMLSKPSVKNPSRRSKTWSRRPSLDGREHDPFACGKISVSQACWAATCTTTASWPRSWPSSAARLTARLKAEGDRAGQGYRHADRGNLPACQVISATRSA